VPTQDPINNGSPQATPAKLRGGRLISEAANVSACPSPTVSNCSGLRRSRRIQAREESEEPRGAEGSSATGQEHKNATPGPVRAAGDSSVNAASQPMTLANDGRSARMQEQPGARMLNARVEAEGGNEDQENHAQQDGTGECDHEGEDDKEQGGEGASAQRGQGSDQAAVQARGEEDRHCEKANCLSEVARENTSQDRVTADSAQQEMVKTEAKLIEELITVLKELNRRFEKEVVAVAAGPGKLAAFVPFRPAAANILAEDEEEIVCNPGVTGKGSKEGVVQIEID
jgi:hypothetical protein